MAVIDFHHAYVGSKIIIFVVVYIRTLIMVVNHEAICESAKCGEN
jgi:hypothetical protein